MRLPFRYEWEMATDVAAVYEKGGPGRGVKAAEHYVTKRGRWRAYKRGDTSGRARGLAAVDRLDMTLYMMGA